jgi:site-specific DNA-methyltransferase (adenine-specific)
MPQLCHGTCYELTTISPRCIVLSPQHHERIRDGYVRRIVGELVRPSNVITMPASSLNIKHPAVYPIGLPDFFIRLMTQVGDVVVDSFLGSGTTALAAMQLGRRYVGIERDEEYVRLAESRIAALSMERE